jgi:hypothetical protein
MAVTMTSIRLDTRLADEAAKILGVKSRTEAVHIALTEIVALKRFKNLAASCSVHIALGVRPPLVDVAFAAPSKRALPWPSRDK